jgi:hydroxyacylglutathione hydrolase
MILERITSSGLAHNSYLVGSGSDAAVIDPRRDCDIYLDLARERELTIKYIFETHRNEDYVVGSSELANLSGAEVYHGPGLEWKYGKTLADGQQFRLGSLLLTSLHTPGHTNESMSYTVGPARGGAILAVFSGDALFAGDVGRTDLYGPSQAQRMASALYDSIFSRLLPLGDEVILHAAHGAGSVCGTRIADRDHTTLGIERKLNPFLRLQKEEFVARKIAEKPETPSYFPQMEKYNLEGAPLLRRPLPPPPLGADEFKALISDGAYVIDTREPPAFGGAHLKGSFSIWLEGIPSFAGWFLPYDRPIVLLLEDASHAERASRYLVRIGFDKVAGYLRGGLETWYNAGLPVETLPLLSVHQLKLMLDSGQDIQVLDVRDDEEWESGHVAKASHIYVGELEHRSHEVPFDRPVASFCTVGHRAGIGASILQRAGHPKIYNVLGSYQAWKAAGFPLTKE